MVQLGIDDGQLLVLIGISIYFVFDVVVVECRHQHEGFGVLAQALGGVGGIEQQLTYLLPTS